MEKTQLDIVRTVNEMPRRQKLGVVGKGEKKRRAHLVQKSCKGPAFENWHKTGVKRVLFLGVQG